MGVLVITHYQRLLNYIKPEFVHVLVAGRIVKSGGSELVEQLEAEGYDRIIRETRAEAGRRGRAGGARAMAVKPQDLMQPGATDYQYGFHDVEDYKFKSGRGT